jgi:aminocarboxymuconate-semialdehyde decarboxylase
MARAKERIPHICDIDFQVAPLDRNGIDMQVVTPVNAMESNLMPGDVPAKLAYARILNDCRAEFMNDSKERLFTCGTSPLEGLEQGGLQELECAVKDLGLKGFSLSSNLNGKPLDLPEFESFWALPLRWTFLSISTRGTRQAGPTGVMRQNMTWSTIWGGPLKRNWRSPGLYFQ